MPTTTVIPYQELTYKIIGAAMNIHNRLGPGLKEDHYQRALAIELRDKGLSVDEEYNIEIYDNQEWLGRLYLDLLVENSVIVETKAYQHLLTNEDIAQVICYLAAIGCKVALLLNFGCKRLEYKRILPPRTLEGWQNRIRPYLWRPKDLSQPVTFRINKDCKE